MPEQFQNRRIVGRNAGPLRRNRYLPDGIDLTVSISLIYNSDQTLRDTPRQRRKTAQEAIARAIHVLQ